MTIFSGYNGAEHPPPPLLSYLFANGKKVVQTLQVCVSCVAWLGTTQYVASGCIDGKVRIWNSLSGNCERTFTGGGPVQSLALTADGTCIVSTSTDCIARVFRI
jgi:WD40 repeat protein